MTPFEEIVAASGVSVPKQIEPEFWERLVRVAATSISDADWADLSAGAREWLNVGVKVLKKKNGKLTDEQADGVPDDVPPLETAAPEPVPEEPEEPLEITLEIAPEPEPEPAKPKRAKKKSTSSRKGRKGSNARGISFQKSKTYWFFDFLIGREGGIAGHRPPDLAREFNKDRPEKEQISEKSATVIVYDTITTLRVLRDRGLYTHRIVEMHADLAKDEAAQ